MSLLARRQAVEGERLRGFRQHLPTAVAVQVGPLVLLLRILATWPEALTLSHIFSVPQLDSRS